MKKELLLVAVTILLISCQSEEDMNKIAPPLPINGGTDFFDVNDFMVQLNADALKSTEKGTWSIFSGEIDDKVSIENPTDPKTIFHGLPGEEYKLLWEVQIGYNWTRDTVTITFVPLKTEILEMSDDYFQTRIMLSATNYDRGEWTVEGDYHHIRGLGSGGVYIPEDHKHPNILFYALEHTTAKITWTTWYGSKSASATVEYTSTEYHQKEALLELQILGEYYYYKENENGDVVELFLAGDKRAWIFEDMEQFPELQGLRHLERLVLSGNPIYKFPQVVTTYSKLKYLALISNYFTNVPKEIGNLTELDTLILSNNPITSLPDNIGDLKKVRFLDLTSINLSSLPASFSDLSSLNYLSLELSTIDKLPENFGNLQNLETFRGPTLLENIPASFSQLKKLKFCFYFSKARIASLPEDFGNLTSLQTLWLYGNYLKLPDSFTNLSELEELQITNGSGITYFPEDFGRLSKMKSLVLTVRLDKLPASITNLTNLKFLNLYGQINYLPVDLGKLSALEGIQVGNTGLRELPESIGSLKNLTFFSSSTNKISSIPESIGGLSKINWLSLSRNQITHFPTSMSNLSGTLKELFVNGNDYSPEELKNLKKMLPNTTITTYQPGD